MSTITIDCPQCGRPLVERTNSENGSTFLGCTGYPACRHTQPIPESVRMRLAGAPEFDFWDEDTDA